MAQRRTHSVIDRLPAELRQALTAMVVDGAWPDGCLCRQEGKPRYEDMVSYCVEQGYGVSSSAVGRWAKKMRLLARMRSSAEIVRDVMADVTAEKATETQRAVAEMVTAIVIDFVSDKDGFNAKEIRDIAKAVKDCTAVSLSADKYIRTELGKKAAVAAESTRAKLGAAGVDRKLIQEIIDEHLGVVKS